MLNGSNFIYIIYKKKVAATQSLLFVCILILICFDGHFNIEHLQQPPPVRGYAPVNQGPLFDDDPGIMSEVETASTGFRRGNKTRSSLPVVRTPSKTLERPLGAYAFYIHKSEFIFRLCVCVVSAQIIRFALFFSTLHFFFCCF